MIYIAHRALFNGPDPEKENTSQQIEAAIAAGFYCEVDVRLIGKKWFLGHDQPDYEVPVEFFIKNAGELWIHCKNLEALIGMSDLDFETPYYSSLSAPHYFWHQEDDFCLTSQKFIWSYPGKPLAPDGILVLPETDLNWRQNILPNCAGICSKYVSELRTKYG